MHVQTKNVFNSRLNVLRSGKSRISCKSVPGEKKTFAKLQLSCELFIAMSTDWSALDGMFAVAVRCL